MQELAVLLGMGSVEWDTAQADAADWREPAEAVPVQPEVSGVIERTPLQRSLAEPAWIWGALRSFVGGIRAPWSTERLR